MTVVIVTALAFSTLANTPVPGLVDAVAPVRVAADDDYDDEYDSDGADRDDRDPVDAYVDDPELEFARRRAKIVRREEIEYKSGWNTLKGRVIDTWEIVIAEEIVGHGEFVRLLSELEGGPVETRDEGLRLQRDEASYRSTFLMVFGFVGGAVLLVGGGLNLARYVNDCDGRQCNASRDVEGVFAGIAAAAGLGILTATAIYTATTEPQPEGYSDSPRRRSRRDDRRVKLTIEEARVLVRRYNEQLRDLIDDEYGRRRRRSESSSEPSFRVALWPAGLSLTFEF